MAELNVNGRKVVVRDYMPAGDNWDVLPHLLAFSGGKYDRDTMVGLLTRAVESWEFDGDPSDPAVYAKLDMFSEMVPLLNVFIGWIGKRLAEAKN